MASLDSFFSRAQDDENLVVGTYIYPFRLLAEPVWDHPLSAIELLTTVEVSYQSVMVTKNGGLFLRPPSVLKATEGTVGLSQKLDFELQAAEMINQVLCELALHGVVSELATPVHISAGKLIDNHALITSAGGGREAHFERTLGPSLQLLNGLWRMWRLAPSTAVDSIPSLNCSRRLTEIHRHLPTLVCAAYSNYSRRELTEGVLDAWICIEQVVDSLWSKYVVGLDDAARKDRLRDPRTYTAAVRIEILNNLGYIPDGLYFAMHRARKHRNDVAHRADISRDGAVEAADALHKTLEFVCGKGLQPPQFSEGVNW